MLKQRLVNLVTLHAQFAPTEPILPVHNVLKDLLLKAQHAKLVVQKDYLLIMVNVYLVQRTAQPALMNLHVFPAMMDLHYMKTDA